MGLTHQSLVSPCHSFFPFPSFSLSVLLSGWLLGAQGLSEFTFLPGLLIPDGEGALHLHLGGGVLCPHPTERTPAASVNRASSVPGALLAFCVNQGRSSLCSLHFAILSPMPSSWGYPWILLGLGPGTLKPRVWKLSKKLYQPVSPILQQLHFSFYSAYLSTWDQQLVYPLIKQLLYSTLW